MDAKNWKFARSSRVDYETLEAEAKAGVQAIEISLGKGIYGRVLYSARCLRTYTIRLQAGPFFLQHKPQ